MDELNRVVICLGSNWNQEQNIERAEKMLRAHFVFIRFAPAVYTDPVNCVGHSKFLNQVVIVKSENSADQIIRMLKKMEISIGRTPEDKSKGRVPIDIDLLRWNDQVLKPEDFERPYVLDGIRWLQEKECAI